jgi:hypothetical protein
MAYGDAYSQENSAWEKVINPATGKPFGLDAADKNAAYKQYSDWASGDADMATWGTTMDWGKTGWGVDQGTGGDWSGYRAPAGTVGFTYGTDQAGYIDPVTGQIVWGNKLGTNQYIKNGVEVTSAAQGQQRAGGDIFDPNDPNPTYRATATGGTYYDPNADYGLGGGELAGIIPVQHSNTGQITYYVPKRGGGYYLGDSLDDAVAYANDYRAWYKEQATPQGPPSLLPAPSPGNSGASYDPAKKTYGGNTGSTGGKPGILTVPGQGEKTFEDIYPELRAGPQRGDRAFGDRPTQPTESEQYWNQWEGIFGSPDSLYSMYDRAEKKAQSTLDRKASSAGWGDSSAAAKATANIGLDFQDAATRATMDWAKTGAGLASGADKSKNDQTRSWLDVVGTADKLDVTDLAYKLGAMGAGKTAQELMEGRETRGLEYGIQIGNAMSALASSGFQDANQEDFARYMVDLQLQMEAGNIDYAAATQKLNEYAALFGTSLQASPALANAWKQTAGGASTGQNKTVPAGMGYIGPNAVDSNGNPLK